jgi:tRNA(adenine34) deaminase
LDLGPADSTDAVLWVHGPDSWSLAWQEAAMAASASQVTELTGRDKGTPALRHIVPDLLGFGRSDKPKKESFHQIALHAQALHALCDRLGLVRVQLVGPIGIQPMLKALQELQPARYALQAAQKPQALPKAWREAPYPDKGYRAGPRSVPRWVTGNGADQ